MLGVPQKDGPLLSDAVAMVELHQLIEGGEELVPHVVLSRAILQNLEMLNMVPVTATKKQKGRRREFYNGFSSIEKSIYEDICSLVRLLWVHGSGDRHIVSET